MPPTQAATSNRFERSQATDYAGGSKYTKAGSGYEQCSSNLWSKASFLGRHRGWVASAAAQPANAAVVQLAVDALSDGRDLWHLVPAGPDNALVHVGGAPPLEALQARSTAVSWAG